MKLLIITQAVDTEDPVLGFFVRWIAEFAKHAEHIEVICLREGKHTLPEQVRVHSLGKERGVSRARYLFNFYRYIWQLRHRYDVVFVHMNQEYVLLGGLLWKVLGTRIHMWRNHYAGSLLTSAAVALCTKVFCTSKHSYTATYAKTTLMPVGVDTERFTAGEPDLRKPNSILFLARMSPSKRPDMLIDALLELKRDGIPFTASFVGSPVPKDEIFYEHLKEKVRAHSLESHISFIPAVAHDQTINLYRAHEIFVNTSPSGMLDKTIFEAAACGCAVLTSSDDVRELAGEDLYVTSSTELAARLRTLLTTEATLSFSLKVLVESNSLVTLARKLFDAILVKS